MIQYFGERVEKDVWTVAFQFPTRRIIAAHSDRQHPGAFAHFNIFRGITHITNFFLRTTEQAHRNFQTLRMRLSVHDLFVTDHYFKKSTQPQFLDFTINTTIISAADYAQPVTLLTQFRDCLPGAFDQLNAFLAIVLRPQLISALPLFFRQPQTFVNGKPVWRIDRTISFVIKRKSQLRE